MSELQKPSLYASRARHLSAFLFHVSARGAITAAATAKAGVCPNKIPTKLVFHWSSLAEFPVILQYISTKSQQKKFPRYRRCAGWRDNSAKRNIAWARLSEKDTPGTLGCCIGLCWAVRAAYEIGPRFSFRFSFSSRQRFRTIFGSYFR